MATVCKTFPTAPIAFLMGFVWTLAAGTAHSQPPPGRAVGPFDADRAREHQEAWAEHLGLPVETTNDIGMVFVLIPPGEFTMGSPEADPAARTSEMPQRVAHITQAFYMGKYPVTQEQWVAVMGRNPSYFRFKGCSSEFNRCTKPVESVAWVDCQEFMRRLNEIQESNEDRLFRLPTEAEWEYACRAGSTTRFSFGDEVDDLGLYAWHGENSGGRTQPVGLKRPNAWGLHDMYGNVWEWCHDWFDRFYYDDAPFEDPVGPDTGRRRVLRGGSWSYGGYPHHFRSAARYLGEPYHRRLNTDGLRAVWTIPPP